MSEGGQNGKKVQSTDSPNGDERPRQVRKTRSAILAAFDELVLQARYQDIRVGEIIERADVGRSTFYEHFEDKDDVLRQSLSRVLGIVASTVDADCDLIRLRHILEHFREQRPLARVLLAGPAGEEVAATLQRLIKERLERREIQSPTSTVLSLDLIAAQAAGALVGLIRPWLNNEPVCSSTDLAAAMHRLVRASTAALLEGATGAVGTSSKRENRG